MFLAQINLCIILSEMPQKFLFLVKTSIFYEPTKLGWRVSPPGQRETGTSDVIPGDSEPHHSITV